MVYCPMSYKFCHSHCLEHGEDANLDKLEILLIRKIEGDDRVLKAKKWHFQ